MLPEHRIRLPLQSGATAVWSLARAAGALVPGLALTVVGIYWFLDDKQQLAEQLMGIDSSLLGFVLLVVAITMGPGLLGFAFIHLRQLWRTRPCDVVIDAEGMEVQGWGRGRRHAWSELNGTAGWVEERWEPRTTLLYLLMDVVGGELNVDKPLVTLWRLIVPRTDGAPMVLAEAERPIERESLEALCDTIRASDRHDPRPASGEQEVSARDDTPQTLRCANCHAVVAPVEQAEATCEYCGAAVPIPDEIRQRLAASRQVARGRQALQQVIRDLVQQPGAGRTGVLMLLAAVPMLAVWPLALLLLFRLQQQGGLELRSAAPLVLAPLALILGLFFLLRSHVANRQALRVLTLGFGARPPERAGDPHSCRRCGGPLPRQPGEMLVGCVFCGADNILALDLRRESAPAREQEVTVDQALRQRRRERLLWAALSVVAVVLVALGVAAALLPLIG